MSMSLAAPISPPLSPTAVEAVPPMRPAAPPASSTRRGLFAASHLALQAVLLNAISLPVMACIVRRLGDVGYGHWTTATSIVASASVLANLGLRGAFVRSVARDPGSVSVREQMTLRLLLTLTAGGIAVAVSLLLPYPAVVRACVAVAAVGLLFTTVNTTLSDLLQGLNRISVYAGTNFIAGLVLTIASVLAVLGGAGPLGLSIAYLAGPIAGAALLVNYVGRRIRLPLPPGEGRGEGSEAGCALSHVGFHPFPEGEGTRPAPHAARRFWRLLVDSRHFAAQQLVGTLSSNIESLLLPLLVDAGAFGCFSAGLLLASRLVVIPDGLGSAFFPLIAARHVADPQAASRELGHYVLLALVICLPVAVGVTAMAMPVTAVLFPHHAATCALVIRITIWSIPLMGIENLMGYALNAAGQDAAQARRNVLWAVLNLAVAIPLVLCFGIVGACLSFVLRTGLKIACIAPLFLATFRPRWGAGRFARAAAAGLIMAAALWLCRGWVPLVSARPPLREGLHLGAALTVQAGGAFSVYVVALLLLRVVHRKDLLLLLRRRPAAAR